MTTAEITYFKPATGTCIQVRVDGRLAGHIRAVLNGFRYHPLHGEPGETFATVSQVKQSLEGDDA